MALRDKDANALKQKAIVTTTPLQDEQVTEVSKLKQKIEELQVQLEKSSISKGNGADQGGGADDAVREKLVSTTVSD